MMLFFEQYLICSVFYFKDGGYLHVQWANNLKILMCIHVKYVNDLDSFWGKHALLKYFFIWAASWENQQSAYAKNKDADQLRPVNNFFSHVRMEPLLPVYYQYF